MKKRLLIATTLTLLMGLTACGKDNDPAVSYSSEITNGDFEQAVENNKIAGWTRSDAAFAARGITNADAVNGVTVEKSGTSFFSGTAGANQVMRGTLTSDCFTLNGTGFITFKLGAGKNPEKCYVEFFEEGNPTAIARVANTDCDGIFITDHLLTKVVDLSSYIGKNIYIVITDNDDGNDFSYLNFDAFKVCMSEDEITTAQNDYQRQIAEYGEKPFIEDETATTIQNGGFETGDLTGWKTLEGTALSRAGVVPASQYYWSDRLVYGEGSYYLDGSNNGAILESCTGAIRSSKFTLAGDGFISFMIGAAPSNCYVAICDAATGEELIVVNNDYFSDPALALTLLRVYVDASEHIGKVLYIKVVDANDASGFAFINVDDFRVSLTREEVANLETEQYEKIQKETYTSAAYDDIATLLNYYTVYPYPVPLNSLTFTQYAESRVIECGTVNLYDFTKDVAAAYGSAVITDSTITYVTFNDQTFTDSFDAFDASKPGYYKVGYKTEHNGASIETEFTLVAIDNNMQVANGDFEAGNLTGWTVLTEGWSTTNNMPNGVISAATYWGEELPYNQEGLYHLDGWNNGIAEPDTWEIQSSNFVLSGSGFISVRMGGHAAGVKVYTADGTLLAHYTQNRFNDVNFPSLAAGGSWADMGTYVMDLSGHIGKELYVVLCDEAVEGWSHAFFDNLVTYYETAPDYANLADIVKDGASTDEVAIPWQLIPSQL